MFYILFLLISFSFNYEVGDMITPEDQEFELEICNQGNGSDVPYVKLSDYNGLDGSNHTVFLITMSAAWCGPCQTFADTHLSTALNYYQDNDNVLIFTNLDDIGQGATCNSWNTLGSASEKIITDDGSDYPLYLMFGSGGSGGTAGCYPSLVYVDHSMQVVHKQCGYPTYAEIRDKIDVMLYQLENSLTIIPDFTQNFTNDIDGDGLLNPGESFELVVSFLNNSFDILNSASFINVEITSDSEIEIIGAPTGLIGNIEVGSELEIPVTVVVSDTATIKDYTIDILFTATDSDGDEVNKEFKTDFTVTLNQTGFPRGVTGELISSVAMVDLDNDGVDEIISADKAGVIHVFENDGMEWSDDTFPYYIDDTQIWGSPAIGDLDGDNNPDMVISAKNGNIYMFDSNGIKDIFNSTGSTGYVTATPALGDIDGDGLDEIIFAQYDNPELLYAINADGSDVTGFPVSIGEKVQRGAALADFNGNGKVDIVIGTDDKNLHLIYDDGTIAWTTEVGNDIRVAPTVLEFNDGEKIILAGSRDDNFYAFNSDGTIRFTVETDDDITSEASVVYIDDAWNCTDCAIGPAIFFASGDYVYGIDMDGQSISNNWPMDIGAEVTSSITFAYVSGAYDNNPVAIFGDEGGKVHVYDVLGSNSYDNFPINHGSPFKGSPTIVDTDGDGDLELLLGSSQSLTNFDIKESGNITYLWNTHRSDMKRSGYYVINDLLDVHKNIQDKEFSILKAYPNPFNPSVNIDYYINKSDFVEINILNLEGKVVDVLESSFKNNGTHSIVWNGNHLSSGVYFINISHGDKVATQKLMLMK